MTRWGKEGNEFVDFEISSLNIVAIRLTFTSCMPSYCCRRWFSATYFFSDINNSSLWCGKCTESIKIIFKSYRIFDRKKKCFQWYSNSLAVISSYFIIELLKKEYGRECFSFSVFSSLFTCFIAKNDGREECVRCSKWGTSERRKVFSSSRRQWWLSWSRSLSQWWALCPPCRSFTSNINMFNTYFYRSRIGDFFKVVILFALLDIEKSFTFKIVVLNLH